MCITIRHHYFDSNVKLSTNILSSKTNRNESEKYSKSKLINTLCNTASVFKLCRLLLTTYWY